MPLIFVVDSSAERRVIVRRMLEEAGFYVEVFTTAHVLDAAEKRTPSLIIVAADLTDDQGTLLREKVRRRPMLSSIPILLLSDNVGGRAIPTHDSGLIDSLVSPFSPAELISAVEGKLEKTEQAGSQMSSSEKGDIVIDPFAMKISVRGREVTTTTLEFRLLDYLARHHGKVFSRDALLDAVWGDLSFVTPRSVDACIRRIRRKIEPESSSPQLLRTVRGTGYRLDAKPSWEVAGGACHCAICAAIRSRASAVPTSSLERDFNSVRRAASPN